MEPKSRASTDSATSAPVREAPVYRLCGDSDVSSHGDRETLISSISEPNRVSSVYQMARFRKPARVVLWSPRKDGPRKHYVFYTDYTVSPPKQKRVLCESMGAVTPEQRAGLVKTLRLQEKQSYVAAHLRKVEYHYDRTLYDAMSEYLTDVEFRVESRRQNPHARIGLAESSGERITVTLDSFMGWLNAHHRKLKCGDVDARLIRRFIEHYATEPTYLGEREIMRSAETVNVCIRNLKTAFRWIDALRPKHFPDFDSLLPAFKALRGDVKRPRSFTPKELQKFAREAAKRSSDLLRIFLLLAVTGCRSGEAFALEWKDVDLQQGLLKIHGAKTGRTRWLKLKGDPSGDISPGLAQALTTWREDSLRHVLNIRSMPRDSWRACADAAGVKLRPKDLRSNFTSYAAAIGVPPSVCAMWQGHTAQVAEEHYRAQVLARLPGASIEEAMGLKKYFGS